MNLLNALNPLRVLCLFGAHRYRLIRRTFLTGHLWMRYDRCARCGSVAATPEQR